MLRFTYLVLLVLGLPSIVSARASSLPESDEGLAAMQELAFMIGEWHGSGWMRRGPGEPKPTESTEKVEERLDGRVLVVEGFHRSKETGDVVHHALALISYDPDTGNYRLGTYLASGATGEYPATLENGNIVWIMDVPGGQVRHTATIKDGVWTEIGEYSADGASWSQISQMNLERLEP